MADFNQNEFRQYLEIARNPHSTMSELESVWDYLSACWKIVRQSTTKEESEDRRKTYSKISQPLEVALAQNPNISPKRLNDLMRVHGESVAKNPALLLMLLEGNHSLLHQNIIILIRTASIPYEVLDFLTCHSSEDIATEVQTRINYAGEAQENWRDEAGPILANLSLTPQEYFVFDRCQRGGIDCFPDWIQCHIPKQELQEFPLEVIGSNMNSYWGVSLDTSELTNETIEKLETLDADQQKIEASQTQKMEVLKWLYNSGNPGIYFYLARNPFLPKEILDKIMASGQYLVPTLDELFPALPKGKKKDRDQKEKERLVAFNDILQRLDTTPLPLLRRTLFVEHYQREMGGLCQFGVLLEASQDDVNPTLFKNSRFGVTLWWETLGLVLNPNFKKTWVRRYATSVNRFIRAAVQERLAAK
jgi:hypothetical protein